MKIKYYKETRDIMYVDIFNKNIYLIFMHILSKIIYGIHNQQQSTSGKHQQYIYLKYSIQIIYFILKFSSHVGPLKDAPQTHIILGCKINFLYILSSSFQTKKIHIIFFYFILCLNPIRWNSRFLSQYREIWQQQKEWKKEISLILLYLWILVYIQCLCQCRILLFALFYFFFCFSDFPLYPLLYIWWYGLFVFSRFSNK